MQKNVLKGEKCFNLGIDWGALSQLLGDPAGHALTRRTWLMIPECRWDFPYYLHNLEIVDLSVTVLNLLHWCAFRWNKLSDQNIPEISGSRRMKATLRPTFKFKQSILSNMRTIYFSLYLNIMKWSKSDRDRQIPYGLSYLWNLKTKNIKGIHWID